MMTRDEAEAAARKGAKVRREAWNGNEWIEYREVAFYDHLGDRVRIEDYLEAGWSIVEPAPTPTPGTVLPLSECGVGWRPTVGRDAVTRDGRRVERLLRRTDFAGVGYIDGRLFGSYYRWSERGEHSLGQREMDLVADWVDAPHDAQAPVKPDLAARVAELETDLTKLEVTVIQLVRMHPKSWFKPGANPDPASHHKPAPSQLNEPVETNLTFRTSRKPDSPGVMGDEEIITSVMKHFGIANPNGEEEQIARDAITLTRQSVLAQLTANEERAVEVGMQVMNDEGYSRDAIRAALAAIREGL